MNKKGIIIIGPAGSGKTKKMEEIIQGKEAYIIFPGSPWVDPAGHSYPDYVVFEEVENIDNPMLIRSFLLALKVSNAITIMISQIKHEYLPFEYFRDEIEIINLHQPIIN